MKTVLLAIAASGALALCACAQKPSAETAERLAGLCQIEPCNCRPDPWSGIDGGETGVYWTDDGRAYCPAGYHLRLLRPPPKRQ